MRSWIMARPRVASDAGPGSRHDDSARRNKFGQKVHEIILGELSGEGRPSAHGDTGSAKRLFPIHPVVFKQAEPLGCFEPCRNIDMPGFSHGGRAANCSPFRCRQSNVSRTNMSLPAFVS